MQELRQLLFFAHVPRTGGRTYHRCFLKALFPPQERCPRSYDALRFNPNHTACRLLATHYDFSLLSRLPTPNVSVMTNMRHPVDRILSAYEFTVENAARSLRWNLELQPGESVIEARKRVRGVLGKGARTATRNVWPWNFLLPLMENDLWQRQHGTSQPVGWEGLNTYEMAHRVMPLSQFVEHPSTLDLLHNGATFHIAGITQNSVHVEAPLLRACACKYSKVGQRLLELAKAVLDSMLHVGLTEEHKESAMLLAAALGRSLLSRAHTGPVLPSAPLRGNISALVEGQQKVDRRSNISLVEYYEKCVLSRKKEYGARRRAAMLLLGERMNFSSEARLSISPGTLSRIRDLNQLDLELLEYAHLKFGMERVMFKERLRAMEDEVAQVEAANLARRNGQASVFLKDVEA